MRLYPLRWRAEREGRMIVRVVRCLPSTKPHIILKAKP